MATKKTRIDRRGKIRSLVRKFPPVKKHHWRKANALAMVANRRQWGREFYPPWTTGEEIQIEHLNDYFLVIESSDPASPSYIITE
tara:strand:+ start:713 stop:967 length:255 start_codon:yes stop_codon:yes gene_type:complete